MSCNRTHEEQVRLSVVVNKHIDYSASQSVADMPYDTLHCLLLSGELYAVSHVRFGPVFIH